MKKLLLTTGILALSIMAFGVEENENDGRIRETGVVEVKARIVQPLKINTEPLDYGIMVPGETKAVGDQPGWVHIIGASGEKIKLEVKDSGENGGNGSYTAYTGPTQFFFVELTTGAGEAENEKMTAKVTLFDSGESGEDYKKGIISLSEEGKLDLRVDGILSAASEQKHGDYKGNIYVRAMYQ